MMYFVLLIGLAKSLNSPQSNGESPIAESDKESLALDSNNDNDNSNGVVIQVRFNCVKIDICNQMNKD